VLILKYKIDLIFLLFECSTIVIMSSPINTPYVDFEALTLEKGWKLYELEKTWTEWFVDTMFYTQTKQSLAAKYVFNNETGQVYVIEDSSFVPVGQFGQETEHPYIYMNDDSGYIRVLPQYTSIIKETNFAKQCNQSYIDTQKKDI
jgi:hypothetical protein